MRTGSYLEYKRKAVWHENSLAGSDEDLSAQFKWSLLSQFGPYVGRYRWPAIGSIVLMLLYTAFNLANPYLIGIAIDQFIRGGDIQGLMIIGVILLAVNVAMWLSQYWQIWSMSWVGQRIIYMLSSDMFKHLQRLSLSFYDRTQIGRVMSRMLSDIEVLESMLSSGLLAMLGSLVALVGIVAAMLTMHVWLALLSFTVVPLMIIITIIWQKYAERSFRQTRAAISLVNAQLQENISGMRVIQSLVREKRTLSEFDELNAYNRDTNLGASKIAALILPMVEVVAALATALIVVYGGIMVARGEMQIGVLVAFTLYINRFYDPIRELSMLYTQLQRSAVAAERIFHILGIPVDIEDKPEAKDLPEIRGEVTFRDVTFGYNQEVQILQGLSLHVKPGQTIAIVGPTGAGKSTIISLLTRFYDIQKGSILIDGRDLREVKQQSLRRQVGVVLQEPFLFTGTIRDNIRYGRLEASDDEIVEAARAVGAHELIMQLPADYETIIQERGRNLSVGQRQLISFARALLADPRILILDEATANIDTFTEQIVQEGLRRLLRNRTAFVIAHRLSTIKSADCIIVLQKGRIIEQGTHIELLRRDGEYASLYAMGFRHSEEEEAVF